MTYIAKLHLIPEWVPLLLNEWLKESMPLDLTVKAGKRHGARVLVVRIEASTAEDLDAKLRAFNTMIEAKGYGPLKD
ncbi:MAG: hypothetical protein J1E97_07940 [Muribaculaceae bacterium]|nr:hypothetical protein [Muribaculaceae bacterium]